MKYTVKTEQQMINLGKKFAQKLKGGEIFLLQGELGSGKTIFTKGLAQGLGIKKVITSPTFVLFKVYKAKTPGIKQLIHADCYRLKKGQEILVAGLDEYLGRDDTVVVVEWGEKLIEYLQNDFIPLYFKVEADKRIITVK